MQQTTLLMVALLTGCSGYAVAHQRAPLLAPFARTPSGLAQACVFRASTIGWALTVPVRDNGVVVGATEGPGYFCYRAGPGVHTVTVEVSDARAVRFTAAPGTRRFLEHRIHVGEDELVLIDDARARRLAAELDYALVAEAPEGEPLPPTIPTVAGLPGPAGIFSGPIR